jgi:hypothetical protein
MLTWPKAAERIADRKNGNESFWNSCDTNLLETLAQYGDKTAQQALPAAELDWLESEFRDFNKVCGYPLHWNAAAIDWWESAVIQEPRFEITRRYKWETAQKPFRWLLARLGRPNKTLIDRRSLKRAA